VLSLRAPARSDLRAMTNIYFDSWASSFAALRASMTRPGPNFSNRATRVDVSPSRGAGQQLTNGRKSALRISLSSKLSSDHWDQYESFGSV
jgi:hypothetical protein